MNFFKVEMVDFSSVNVSEEESVQEMSYKQVLNELGVSTASDTEIPIHELPVFPCLVDIDDLHTISGLLKIPSRDYCQLDFKDGSRSYIKARFEDICQVLETIAAVHSV